MYAVLVFEGQIPVSASAWLDERLFVLSTRRDILLLRAAKKLRGDRQFLLTCKKKHLSPS
jgi:hypothetical protein